MPGKLFVPALIGVPMRELAMPLIASVGYHGFREAVASNHGAQPNWHLVLQLDRFAAWSVERGPVLALRPGMIGLIPPGHAYNGVGRVDHPNAHLWLELNLAARHGERHTPFDRGDLRRLGAAFRSHGCAVLAMTEELHQACRRLVPAILARPRNLVILRAELAVVLAGVAASATAGPGTGGDTDPLMREAMARIDATLTVGRVAIASLAHSLGLSPSVFSRRLKAATGLPPATYVAWRRTVAAVERLRAGAPSVTRVAHDLGFPSSQHLAASCRRYLGGSPTGLR